MDYRFPAPDDVLRIDLLRSRPDIALRVCAPYDGKHRSKPGRCSPGHGDCGEVS